MLVKVKSRSKIRKRARAGPLSQVARVLFSLCSFNTSPLYYLRAWHRLCTTNAWPDQIRFQGPLLPCGPREGRVEEYTGKEVGPNNKIGFFQEVLLKSHLLCVWYFGFGWSGWLILITSEILIIIGICWPVSSDKWKAPLVRLPIPIRLSLVSMDIHFQLVFIKPWKNRWRLY